jgi:hypothetical protein
MSGIRVKIVRFIIPGFGHCECRYTSHLKSDTIDGGLYFGDQRIEFFPQPKLPVRFWLNENKKPRQGGDEAFKLSNYNGFQTIDLR